MKKMSVVICVAVVSLFVAAGLAHADAAWIGSTGLILTPSADVAADGSADLQAHFIDRANDVKLYGGTFGLGHGLEVATSVVDPDGAGTNTLLHFKYSHPFDTGQAVEPLRVAFGMNDVSNQLDRSYYVVATKALTIPEETMAGLGVRSAEVSLGFANSNNGTMLDGVFVGARADLPYGLCAMLEYDTDDLNFGVQYRLGGFGLDVAILDGDPGYGAVFSTGF